MTQLVTRPSAITFLDGGQQRIYVFACGQHKDTNDGNLYVNWFDGSSWAWANQMNPGTTVTGTPTAITYRDETGKQHIYVFVCASGNLYANWWDGSHWAWANLGNPGATVGGGGAPAAITYRDDQGKQRIYVFVPGDLDPNLYVKYWDGQQWHWANQNNPGSAMSGVSPVTYLDSGRQRIYAFCYTDAQQNLQVNYWDGQHWHWSSQGGPGADVVGIPAAVTYRDNQGKQRIYVFVSRNDDHLLVNYWDGQQWHWADQNTPPGTDVTGQPAAITYLEGGQQRIYAFVGGEDDNLHVNWWDGSQWAWASQGNPGRPVGAAAAITYLDGQRKQRIYVFAVGDDGNLYVRLWDGNLWAWANQGAP